MLRLMFPVVQQNTSAVTILPTFLEVCGRELDATTAHLDRFWDDCAITIIKHARPVTWGIHFIDPAMQERLQAIKNSTQAQEPCPQ